MERSRAVGTATAAALVAAVVFAGCLGDDPGEMDAYVFSERDGPGDVAPLIPLTDDVQRDAAAILAACEAEAERVSCLTEHLKAVLGAVGSEYAFSVLEAMGMQDPSVSRVDHPMAHELGRHALYVYGTIGNTLTNCSHKVFQGCLHGALQEFFQHVGELESMDLDRVCPSSARSFEIYACMHGLGHGLVLATGYHLSESLDHCARLSSGFAQRSCYGGAFMENVVAHNDHLRAGGPYPGYAAYAAHYGAGAGGDAHHEHKHGDESAPPPRYWVEPDDPEFPCSVVKRVYEPSCWRMQTSLVLFLNGGDFPATAAVCAGLREDLHEACYNSLGRDASAWTQRDARGVSARCANAHTAEMRAVCIQGAVTELVTNYADPHPGVPYCEGMPESDRAACYEGLGRGARSHLDRAGQREFCAGVEEGYTEDCRRGAGL